MKKNALISLVALLVITGCGIVPQAPVHEQKPPVTAPTTSDKKIALTFDDGPYGESTDKILDILKKENIHATFFILGKNTEQRPEQVMRIIKEGNVVGNHSYDHAQNLAKLTAAQFKKNLDRAENAIYTATGLHTTLYRPPYGSLSDTMKTVLKDEGYRTVLWNIDPEDWNYEKTSSTQIVERVMAAAKPSTIVLLHDGRDTHINYPRDNTIAALPILIEELKKQGYTFVTIDQLTK